MVGSNAKNIAETLSTIGLGAAEIGAEQTVFDWRTSKDPQNIQVFKKLFDAKGVDPRLRNTMILVNGRYVAMEDFIIGHYGMVDSNPTRLMEEAEELVNRAQKAVKAIEGISANLDDYLLDVDVPVLDLDKMAGIRYGTDFMSFLDRFIKHQEDILTGNNAIDTKNLKISFNAKRLLNIHGNIEGLSDSSQIVSRDIMNEIMEDLSFNAKEISDLTSSHYYSSVWMNPQDAISMLGLTDQEFKVLNEISKSRRSGLDKTARDLIGTGVFDNIETDRSKLTKIIHSLNKKRLMNVTRDPIHGPGSGYQGLLFITDKLEQGGTISKHWTSAINVADYDGDTLVVNAILRGTNNIEAFKQGISQLVHLKSSAYHAQDEAWMLMDYTMKDYINNLRSGVIGMDEAAEGATRELTDLINLKTGNVRLSDILGVTIEAGRVRVATADELLRMQGRAINELVNNNISRASMVGLLEQGVQAMGDVAVAFYGPNKAGVAASALSTIFGTDALTKGGFRRLGLDEYIDSASGVIKGMRDLNNKAAIKQFTAAKMIGQYVNIVQNNVTMMRKYAESDDILQRLVKRVNQGGGSQAEKILVDIFSPGGNLLSQADRKVLVDALEPVREEIEHITIKALKGNELDLSSYKYVNEIMNTIISPDYKDLVGFDYKGGAAFNNLLNLYKHTGVGTAYEGMDATLITNKFRSGMLNYEDALTAKILMMFTAFNSMTDEDRGLAMRHALGKPPLLPGAAEKAVYKILGKINIFTQLPRPPDPGKAGELSGYKSYAGINLSTALPHNIAYINNMTEIAAIKNVSGSNVFKFGITPDTYMLDNDMAMLDAATHFIENPEDSNIKVRKIIWEYTPAGRDEFGNVKSDHPSILHTGKDLLHKDRVEAILEKKFKKKPSRDLVKETIRKNLSSMRDLEIDPGQRLAATRRVKVKGFSKMLSDALAIDDGENEANRIWQSVVDDLYHNYGLVIEGQAGSSIQNALSASGGHIPSEILQIHPESPGLLGITPDDVNPAIYRPILKMTDEALKNIVIEYPHIKYAAQRSAHGKYLWEDPYMHKYLMGLDKESGARSRLGLVNWIQYQAYKNTPAAFPEFRGGSVAPRNAPAMVSTAIFLGKGPTTSGAILTPFGSRLKTGDQIYQQMKFSNKEVGAATDLIDAALNLKFQSEGVFISKSGIALDFSKVSKTGAEWEAFEKRLRGIQINLPGKTSPELFNPRNYDNIKWEFNIGAIRDLYKQTGGSFNASTLSGIGEASLPMRIAKLKHMFGEINKGYDVLSAGDENFTFNWHTVNTAPVHYSKFISGMTKAMTGVGSWKDFGSYGASLKERGVSLVIGPDVKIEGFTSALADTIHVRWIQNALIDDARDLTLKIDGGSLQVVRKSTGSTVDLKSIIEKYRTSKIAINDIFQDVLKDIEPDTVLTDDEGAKILKSFIDRVNIDKRLKTVAAQKLVDINDILITEADSTKWWNLTSNVTHQQANLSRGPVDIAIDQMARQFGTDEADKVLKYMLGSINKETYTTKMSVLASAALHHARNIYGGEAGNIFTSAKIALNADDPIKIIYAQEYLYDQKPGDTQYRIQSKAIADIAEDIKDKKVMIIADDMAQASAVHKEIRDTADDIVTFVGGDIDLSNVQQQASKTFSLGSGKDTGEWAQQILKDIGGDAADQARASAKGLQGRAIAGAMFNIAQDGMTNIDVISPRSNIMSLMFADTAGNMLRKTVPFLKSYWKPMAGITAALVGLGVGHRIQAASYETGQAEEYVPASQRTRTIRMMRNNSGYNRDQGRRNTLKPQHPGTMQIETPTDIIINEEEYINEAELSRLLNKHLRT